MPRSGVPAGSATGMTGNPVDRIEPDVPRLDSPTAGASGSAHRTEAPDEAEPNPAAGPRGLLRSHFGSHTTAVRHTVERPRSQAPRSGSIQVQSPDVVSSSGPLGSHNDEVAPSTELRELELGTPPERPQDRVRSSAHRPQRRRNTFATRPNSPLARLARPSWKLTGRVRSRAHRQPRHRQRAVDPSCENSTSALHPKGHRIECGGPHIGRHATQIHPRAPELATRQARSTRLQGHGPGAAADTSTATSPTSRHRRELPAPRASPAGPPHMPGPRLRTRRS